MAQSKIESYHLRVPPLKIRSIFQHDIVKAKIPHFRMKLSEPISNELVLFVGHQPSYLGNDSESKTH